MEMDLIHSIITRINRGIPSLRFFPVPDLSDALRAFTLDLAEDLVIAAYSPPPSFATPSAPGSSFLISP